jgi:hypothetical protein
VSQKLFALVMPRCSVRVKLKPKPHTVVQPIERLTISTENLGLNVAERTSEILVSDWRDDNRERLQPCRPRCSRFKDTKLAS